MNPATSLRAAREVIIGEVPIQVGGDSRETLEQLGIKVLPYSPLQYL